MLRLVLLLSLVCQMINSDFCGVLTGQ